MLKDTVGKEACEEASGGSHMEEGRSQDQRGQGAIGQ